jgi:antitoxin VapB
MLGPMQDRSGGRHVSLFRNGANQALRIPKEFELPGTEAILTQEGDALVVRAARPRSLLAALRGLKPIREAFPAVSDMPPEPIEFE